MQVFDYPFVRDVLVVNERVNAFCASYQGPGPAVLLARTVTLQSDLRVGSGSVVIVADVFDGNGLTIDATGVNSDILSVSGLPGVWPGFLPGNEGIPAGPGGDGGSGSNGGDGTHAGSVVLLCREARNVRILAVGGNGTNGASGANGAPGVNGFFRDGFTEPDHVDPNTGEVTTGTVHPPIEIPGTSGGNGGNGGSGGHAGNGGTILFTRILEDRPPVLDVTVGQPGAGAGAGAKGPPGSFGEDLAVDGTPGNHGTPGLDGTLNSSFATNDAEFGVLIRPLIGDNFANDWGPFRVAMGDFHYRQYNPPLDSDETDPSTLHLKDAVRELSRGLELQPDNALGVRLLHQLVGQPKDVGDGQKVWVGGGINALGLSRELDLVPDFTMYQTAFDAAVPQLLAVALEAIRQLSATSMQDSFSELAKALRNEAIALTKNLSLDVPAAEQEKAFALKAVASLDSQLSQIRVDIEANLAAMNDHEFNMGELFGTLAQVGSAVVGVIAAIPSFGTSLVGLVPALVSLSDKVLADTDEVVKSLFSGGAFENEAVRKAYGKVDKQAEAVIKGGKTIVNFIKVVKEIGARATPDNAPHIALLKRGVEVTHQLLIASNRVTIADQQIATAKAKVSNAEALVAQADATLGAIAEITQQMKSTAFLALSLARTRSDAAMRLAFRAQRSAEIYTLLDQSDKVHLDAGMISPEVDRQYSDGEILEPVLIEHLMRSWTQVLEPIRLQEAYLAYFDSPHGTDWHRMSFRSELDLDMLKSTKRFSFRIDPADLPPQHLEAKVRAIRSIALVGARHPNANISSEIRRGAIYEHRLAGGKIYEQTLLPRLDRKPVKLGELAAEEGFSDGPPLSAPNSLSFWGRGVCGLWEVSIPEDQLSDGLLDLSALSLIQVWIGYQFRLGPA